RTGRGCPLQRDRERRALPRDALDREIALHSAREIPADREPESDPFTRVPQRPAPRPPPAAPPRPSGREHREKDAGEPVRRDAWAVILNASHHVVIRRL